MFVVVDNQINELFILINNKVFSVPLIDFGVILCNTLGYHILAYPHRLPPPFVGYHAFPLGTTHDPTWYFDIGATHHMTNNEVVFQDISPYLGNTYVLAGSEASLPIAHTGFLPFHLGSHQFQLNNVLHVPSIRKNLFFVSQFTKDNSVVVTTHPFSQVISDFCTSPPLFQGRCKNHLYVVSLSRSFAFHAVSSSLWHSRLGLPSFEVLSKLSLGSMSTLHKEFCKPCAISKSHKLRFHSNKVIALFPFYLIHSDVWMSSTPSTSGFRYYILLSDDYSRYSWIFPMLPSEPYRVR